MSDSVRDKVQVLAKSTRTAAPKQPQQASPKPAPSSTVSVADLQRQLQEANQRAQQAEQARQQAEQLLQQAELSKKQAEQAKQQAELRAQQSEQAKQQAEQRVADLEKRLASSSSSSSSSSSTVDPAATQTFVLDEVVNQSAVAIGAFKEVKRGEWHRTPVAISVLKKAYPTKAEQEDFQHDTRVLTRLRHPNIVLLIAVTPPGYTPMAVMTELMSGGSLWDYIRTRCRDAVMSISSISAATSTTDSLSLGVFMKESQKTFILRSAILGLNYMHSQKIAHRDVKSPNLLVSDDLTQVKWCDFGLARNRNEKESTMTDAQVGSVKWMAPEVMDPYQKSDGYAADRYAMGIIAWEVLTLEELYPKMNVGHIINFVLHRQKRPPVDGMSGKFRPLCEGLWKQNPAERISLADALKMIEDW